jgi:hypothetical protein
MTAIATQTSSGDTDTTGARTELAPIALGAGEGEALWFLGLLAMVKASSESTGGRVAVMEHLAPRGSGSPLHVHHREDEWFYIVTEPAGFEGFMRRCAEPAERQAIPPAPTEPPDVAGMAAIAAEYGIDIIGPPGIPA